MTIPEIPANRMSEAIGKIAANIDVDPLDPDKFSRSIFSALHEAYRQGFAAGVETSNHYRAQLDEILHKVMFR